MTSFRKGQKVVCIIRGVWLRMEDLAPALDDPIQPRRGAVYVIERIEQIECGRFQGKQMLKLVGVPGTWMASSFRPIVARKTDISIFKRMLKPASARRASVH